MAPYVLMRLSKEDRKKLREQMQDAFDTPSLALFLDDNLGYRLENIVQLGVRFPMQCQEVIWWAEREGHLVHLLQEVLEKHHNSAFKAFASQLIDAHSAPALAAPKPRDAAEGAQPFEHYLRVLLNATSHLRMPGFDQPIQLEAIWTQPSFDTQEGATPLRKILATRAVAIEAPAGFGKTTLSKMVAIALARDYLRQECPTTQSWQRRYLGVDPGPQRHLPVLVDLRSVEEIIDARSLTKVATPSMSDDDHANIENLIAVAGDVVFILDGLDEIDHLRRSRVIELISKVRLQWPECYFIITSRVFPPEKLAGADISLARMSKLTRSEVEELARHWEGVISGRLKGSGKPGFLSAIQRILTTEVMDSRFVNSPLVVAFLASTYNFHRGLPENRAQLFEGISDWLLASREIIRDREGVDLSTTKQVLESVAFSRLADLEASTPEEAIVGAARLTGLASNVVEKVINIESAASNCLIRSGDRLSFWHETLRDYFAASWLIRQFRLANGRNNIPREMAEVLNSDELRDVGDMLISLLMMRHPTHLLRLLEGTTPLGDVSNDNVRAAALQSRILKIADSQGFQFEAELERAISRRAASYLVLSEENMLSMSLTDRAEVLRALSRLGKDSRLFGPPLKRALPIGNSGLKAGRFPITVQEYDRYLRDVITTCRVRLPLEWEQQSEMRNAAVTGVDWEQANYYCAWLTRETNKDKSLSGTVVARLPTLEEWHAIADDCRVGADTSDSSLPPRWPVGVHLEEAGAFGHQDLFHGVWEWIGPPLKNKRRRRNVIQKSVSRRVRGSMQSREVGFRIVFAPTSIR